MFFINGTLASLPRNVRVIDRTFFVEWINYNHIIFFADLISVGDLVVIDGLVIHQSEPNTSDQPRMAYTFHVIDGSVSYSSENWLQPTSANTFEKLNDVDVQA